MKEELTFLTKYVDLFLSGCEAGRHRHLGVVSIRRGLLFTVFPVGCLYPALCGEESLTRAMARVAVALCEGRQLMVAQAVLLLEGPQLGCVLVNK